jgi:tetratricopeptide (TPR) repeat protein
MRSRLPLLAALLTTATTAMAIDLAALWDFRQPALSEQRLRAALAGATGDDALILQTQIARSYGLRGDFATAREVLKSLEPGVATAGPEARARYALELGRTYASATHPSELRTPAAQELARGSYEEALRIARAAGLDALAIDAIHMLAFVDTAPADQLRWAQEALAVVEGSSQPAARKWEASVRNNAGYALHQLGRFDEALVQFRQALVLREQGTDAQAIRIAHWMVAWTLRALGRADEALAIQLRLERECDAAKAPDRFVYEELALLYRAKGDAARADHYAQLGRSVGE